MPIILGIKCLRSVEEVSKQGLVLTSISQHFKSESIMKSYPKISKQFFLFNKLILGMTA